MSKKKENPVKKQKTKRKKIWGRLIFLLLVLFILYQRYPGIFKNAYYHILSLLSQSDKSNRRVQWLSVAPGIESCTIRVSSTEAAVNTDLFLLRFDPYFIQAGVIYRNRLTTAQEVARTTGAIAVINGSFFDPSGKPLGLVIENGTIIQQMPLRSMHNSGIFCIKHDVPYIFHRSNFSASGTSQAIQSMPRLIHRGNAVSNLKNAHEIKRRSGIAIDYDGKIIIYATDTHLSGLSLFDVQTFLLKPELRIQSALNLDGGRSSQLYFKYDNYFKYIVGLAQVPVFLVFFPKEE